LRRVVSQKLTDVSEVLTASIIRAIALHLLTSLNGAKTQNNSIINVFVFVNHFSLLCFLKEKNSHEITLLRVSVPLFNF
jgi:hypothetical protein